MTTDLLNTFNVTILSIKKFLEAIEVKNASKTDQNSEISKVSCSVGSEKQDLRHFSTSADSKKFSMGDMITFKVSKRLP